MPNWNENIITIEGDDYEINRLLEKSVGTASMDDGSDNEIPFLMENFFPCPKKEDSDKPFDGWYQWRLQNWGCKWDMDNVFCDRNKKEVELSYQTPWGPNSEFWDKISEDFPKLNITLSYYEGGMMFGGRVEWEDGDRTVDNHYAIENGSNIDELKDFAIDMKDLGFEWAYNDIHEYVITDLLEELEEEKKENTDEG